MNRTELTFPAACLAACLLATTGCNEQPLADADMDGGGIELGEDSEGGTGDEVPSDDAGNDSDSDSDGGDETGDSGFPGDGDDSGDDGDDSDGAPDCGGDRVELANTPPHVMLVLDKSGSMTNPRNNWDHDNDPATDRQSRWTSLYDVVDNLLTQYDDAMNVGAVLFPATNAFTGGTAEQACMMEDAAEVPVAADNAAAILANIPGRTDQTGGGTPARFGIINAVDHLSDISEEGPRAMILVTDGEANCVPGVDDFSDEYDAELEVAVGSAFADNGIPTYVVGIDIDDEELSGNDTRTLREAMNDIADAGGVARNEGGDRFYNVSDHDALQAALDAIAQRVECTVSLTDLPADPEYVELTIDGQVFDRVDSCEDGEGWRFTSDTAPFNTIELCGAACDRFVEVGAVQTEYTCRPVG